MRGEQFRSWCQTSIGSKSTNLENLHWSPIGLHVWTSPCTGIHVRFGIFCHNLWLCCKLLVVQDGNGGQKRPYDGQHCDWLSPIQSHKECPNNCTECDMRKTMSSSNDNLICAKKKVCTHSPDGIFSIQEWARLPSLGCKNVAGKLRQVKVEVVSNNRKNSPNLGTKL